MTTSKFITHIATVLATTVWTSSFIFGLYIISFYFIGLLSGVPTQWNDVLPGLYDENTRAATMGIGLHFAAGGIVLILGCIQLIEKVRTSYPSLHKWLGRIYVLASILTALGGLVFIFIKGTIGGIVMDIAFAGYGILTFLCAVQTIRFAMIKKFDRHRAWAIRLFALAIGSWLYRMDYGFWFLFTGGAGHNSSFTGPFDYFMDFFFYLPNLWVAEFFISGKKYHSSPPFQWIYALLLLLSTVFLALATYYFTRHYWGPAIFRLFV